MPEMRNFEAEAAEFVRRGEHRIEGLFHHAAQAAPQAPAEAPATIAAAPVAAPAQEDSMQLTDIANDIKGAVENADEWVKQVTDTHLPAILAVAQKYEASPIVQALKGALLPPSIETQIAGMISELAKTYPVQAAPAAPVQTDQPAVAVAQ